MNTESDIDALTTRVKTLTAERDTWEKRARSLCDERAALTGAAMKAGLVVSCGKDGHRITHEPELALQIALTRAQDADVRIAALEASQSDFLQAAKETGYASDADDAFRQVAQAIVFDVDSYRRKCATLEASRDAAVERVGELQREVAELRSEEWCCVVCRANFGERRAALSTAAPTPPLAIQGTPLAEVDPFFCVWRCSCCGDMNDNIRDTRWRWDGEAWEHACGGPQDGHYPARNFGPHPATAAPTKTEEPR